MSSASRDSPLFSDFCRLLESISARKGTDLKKQRLEKYVQEWRARYGDFFDAMRLLLPHLDKERTTYGMKEQVLAKTYVDVLGLGKDSEDANYLIHWRMPGKNKQYQKIVGDFASVAYEVIASRSTVIRGTMTVHDVNQQLDTLSITSGRQQQRDIIRHFFVNYTADEQKWIIRVILKELKVGMSENSVLNVFHSDAFNLFNVCSSLHKVCVDLKDPFIRLSTNDIAIFYPIKPQLAHKELPQDVPKAMGGTDKFYIQQKLDGERLQLHVKDGVFRYWSRKTTDYTHLYGANENEGTLTPYIYNCFHHKARSLILDGEMVAWDPIGEQYLPFGTLKSAALDQTDGKNKARPCFIVFDIVYCNGTPIIEQPLSERVAILPKIITEKKGHLEILPHTEGSSVQDVVDELDKAVAARQEGIVIKNPSCTYAPGQRNKDWIKVKPDYVDSLGDDVDVLIIGGIYGTGRRGDRLSHFMCAIKDNNVPLGSEPRLL
ncbi:hypothetical protein BC936DRAFT_139632 [Jimgerdemannia flammicorona]|uniref:DNA ligase (ATP) n=1 Tax=Jimgerdemannia flammicorona TaxID=994334 RepID=A0A433B9I8_9FUNG|nr:hypothetical protein BC936DRAFT_139632 [Jimgerdemannia flammicorona]